MPELPELEVVRERLGPRLLGRTIADVVVSRRFGFLLRTPADQLAGALSGTTVTGFERRGKFMSVVTTGPRLVLNPMLGGRFLWTDHAVRSTDSTLVRLLLDGGEELRLTDFARMARIYLARSQQELDAVPGWSEMGPEADVVSMEEWSQRIRRHPGELKNLLRNQAFVAGIGNAYSDEILWQARLLPLRRRSTLDADGVRTLWEATRVVLPWATDQIRGQPDYTSEKQNRAFLRVHMKGGESCPRCGHRISELNARGEITDFCRGCQR